MAALTRSFEDASNDSCAPRPQPVAVHSSSSAGHLQQHYAAPPAAATATAAAAAVYQNVRSLSGPSGAHAGGAGRRPLVQQLSQGADTANGSGVRKNQLLEDLTQYLSGQPQYQNVGGHTSSTPRGT